MKHTDNLKIECKHCSCYLGNLHINTDTETNKENVVTVPFKKNNSTVTKVTSYIKNTTKPVKRKKGVFRRPRVDQRIFSVTEIQFKCNRCSKHTTIYYEKQI